MQISSLRAVVTFVAFFIIASPHSGAAASHHAKKKSGEPANAMQAMEEATRLQIFLDNSNFGPGKLDGRGGNFTRKALALYRKSIGLPDAVAKDLKIPPDVSGIDLSSVTPVFISYTVTKEDGESVGDLPSGPVAQAKVKWLPYKTLLEAIAEKFHSDAKFIKELNSGKTDHLKPGDEIKAPNVKPFELSSVKTIKPGEGIAAIVANELGEDAAKPETGKKSGGEPGDAKSPPPLTVHVSIKESILEVLAGEKVAAAFPVTVGAKQTVSPVGNWTVKAIAKLPTFRYDLKMLNHGERSSNSHLLPPGPNNPVGVMWIALNKKGIGIHGTEDPDSIGRSASHGCIRLANWDIVKLAEMVKPGMHVTIE